MMGTKQGNTLLDIGEFNFSGAEINFEELCCGVNGKPSTARFEDVKYNDLESIALGSCFGNTILHTNLTSGLSNDEEDTLDVASLYPQQFIPTNQHGAPQRHIFPGEINFELQVSASDTQKDKYVYSNKLNRIYVNMECNFPIQFSWVYRIAPQPMYVRATTVFSDDTQTEKRVETCLQHKDPGNTSNTGLPDHIFNHVLRSTRPVGTTGVYYTGEVTRQDSWYSVLVAFPTCPDTEVGTCSHVYKFVCKNSCSSGINRRSIDIIFTLEDAKGIVYGRQIVGARVCACPRRDMRKDEESEGMYRPGKKRVQSNMITPEVKNNTPGKRMKVEVKEDDDEVLTLPPLQIIGAKTMSTGLSVMLSTMEQIAQCKKNDPRALEKYNKAIASLKSYLDKLKHA